MQRALRGDKHAPGHPRLCDRGGRGLLTPTTTDRYVKEALLGRGAWGVVHRARDSVIGRIVALKVISFDPELEEADRHELAQRSEREARAAGALNHPNIVTLYDAGRSADDASFFIVMEYVDGSTLRQSLARGPLPPAETARIGAQIADALHYAHERGIVHRDVKPANMLIREDGVAKLADFGIARMESSEITRTGQSMGSPAYMSPEQALGRAVDARSDIFSLGVVLYEMLTGKKPFEGDTPAVICFKIVSEEPIPPSRANPAIPREWDALVMKAVAKKPEERFPSAAGMAVELRKLAGVTATPRRGVMPPGELESISSGRTLIEILETPRRPARRRALILIGVAAAILATGIILTQLGPRLMPHATVDVELSHGLRTGEIVVEADGVEYWRQTVAGSDEGGFKEFTRKLTGRGGGHAEARLRLTAGEHTFTVTVSSGDETWHDSVHRRLFAGGAETLSVRVRTGLNRGMELEWK